MSTRRICAPLPAAAAALGAAVLLWPLLPGHALAATPDAATCQALAQASTPRQVIAETHLVPAGPLAAPRRGPPRPAVRLPEHCLVRGALDPRTGAGGRKYQIGFELRLPVQWNGRFLYQGGGGLDGIVTPAIGPAGVSAEPALARGFAVVSTDSGHQGLDASFGTDQQARLDFAYAAIGKVTREADDLITRFYGRRPRYSYFMGCSNGGREAMMAAERFPDAFDGIVAGDPGFDLSAAAVEEMWDTRQFNRVAPHDAQGRPILASAFTDPELKLVSDAVLRQCDGLDGLVDGMINDVAGCHFDPAVLQCRSASQHDCLAPEKVAALRAIFQGARDSQGRALYPGWPYDGGLDGPGWRAWKLGRSPTGAPNAINATLGLNAMQGYFVTPPDPGLEVASFDFDTARQRTAQTAAINDATSTFLTSFAAHGGRMLIYQGMSDPVFSASDIMRWYTELTHQDPGAAAYARLFLVPGMNHCMGGPATDDFDMLSAIVAWTERGQAPERIVAHGRAFPGVTRPLCSYPKYAHYQGGDRKAAASFVCR